MGLVTILFVVSSLVCLVAWIWLLVIAFRASIGWGLLIFFLSWLLVPVVVFAVKFWSDAKRPIILYALGMILAFTAGGVAVFVMGMELGAMAGENGAGVTTGQARSGGAVLPPPRPTARATHPSWEAVVKEIEREDDGDWEALVPTPTPVTGRASGLTWDELPSHVGRRVVVKLTNDTTVVATLEAAASDSVRIRHVIGGGEASYWIKREEIEHIRLAN